MKSIFYFLLFITIFLNSVSAQIKLGSFYKGANFLDLAWDETIREPTAPGDYETHSAMRGGLPSARSHYLENFIEYGDWLIECKGVFLFYNEYWCNIFRENCEWRPNNYTFGNYDDDWYNDYYHCDDPFGLVCTRVYGHCDDYGVVYSVSYRPAKLYIDPTAIGIGSFYYPGDQYTGTFVIQNTGVLNLSGTISSPDNLSLSTLSFSLEKNESITVRFNGNAPGSVTGPDGFARYIYVNSNAGSQVISILGRTIPLDGDEPHLVIASPEQKVYDNELNNNQIINSSINTKIVNQNTSDNIKMDIKSKDEIVKVQKRCKELLENYPDSTITVVALDYLWKTSIEYRNDKEIGIIPLKVFLNKLLKLKKKELYYYAGLFLAGMEEKQIKLKVLDEIIENSPNKKYIAYALFQKFTYFLLNKSDSQSADSIYCELENNFHNLIEFKYAKNLLESYGKKIPSLQKSNKVSNNIVKKEFMLFKNYPNPFNPNTTIVFSLPKESYVKVTIYNSLGQSVKVLVDDIKNEGINLINWNGRDDSDNQLPSGIYYYRLETPDYSATNKMLLIK